MRYKDNDMFFVGGFAMGIVVGFIVTILIYTL